MWKLYFKPILQYRGYILRRQRFVLLWIDSIHTVGELFTKQGNGLVVSDRGCMCVCLLAMGVLVTL